MPLAEVFFRAAFSERRRSSSARMSSSDICLGCGGVGAGKLAGAGEHGLIMIETQLCPLCPHHYDRSTEHFLLDEPTDGFALCGHPSRCRRGPRLLTAPANRSAATEHPCPEP